MDYLFFIIRLGVKIIITISYPNKKVYTRWNMTKPVLYSSTSCAPCKQVKTWLAMNKIDYDELDIFENAAEVQRVSGYLTAPTLVFNDSVVIGPNYGRLSSLLKG